MFDLIYNQDILEGGEIVNEQPPTISQHISSTKNTILKKTKRTINQPCLSKQYKSLKDISNKYDLEKLQKLLSEKQCFSIVNNDKLDNIIKNVNEKMVSFPKESKNYTSKQITETNQYKIDNKLHIESAHSFENKNFVQPKISHMTQFTIERFESNVQSFNKSYTDDDDSDDSVELLNNIADEAEKIIANRINNENHLRFESLEKNQPYENPKNNDIEVFSKFCIVNRKIPQHRLNEMMINVKVIYLQQVSPENIQALSQAENTKEWATIGIIKHITKNITKDNCNRSYCCLTLTDFHCEVFVIVRTNRLNSQLHIKSIVAIKNAFLREHNSHDSSSLTLEINNDENIKILGESKDFGFCKGMHGTVRCKASINKQKTDLCDIHFNEAYTIARSNRLNLQSSAIIPHKMTKNVDLKPKPLTELEKAAERYGLTTELENQDKENKQMSTDVLNPSHFTSKKFSKLSMPTILMNSNNLNIKPQCQKIQKRKHEKNIYLENPEQSISICNNSLEDNMKSIKSKRSLQLAENIKNKIEKSGMSNAAYSMSRGSRAFVATFTGLNITKELQKNIKKKEETLSCELLSYSSQENNRKKKEIILEKPNLGNDKTITFDLDSDCKLVQPICSSTSNSFMHNKKKLKIDSYKNNSIQNVIKKCNPLYKTSSHHSQTKIAPSIYKSQFLLRKPLHNTIVSQKCMINITETQNNDKIENERKRRMVARLLRNAKEKRSVYKNITNHTNESRNILSQPKEKKMNLNINKSFVNSLKDKLVSDSMYESKQQQLKSIQKRQEVSRNNLEDLLKKSNEIINSTPMVTLENEKIINRLSELDALEKMSNEKSKVTELKVRCHHCLECRKIFEKIPELCQDKGHKLTSKILTKYFFRCQNPICREKISIIGKKMCIQPCRRCQGVRWTPASIFSDKTLGIDRQNQQEKEQKTYISTVYNHR